MRLCACAESAVHLLLLQNLGEFEVQLGMLLRNK